MFNLSTIALCETSTLQFLVGPSFTNCFVAAHSTVKLNSNSKNFYTAYLKSCLQLVPTIQLLD